MKSNVKMKKVMSMVLIVLVVLCTTTVHAANDSFKTTLRADHVQAKGDDIVMITIGLKDINIESGDKGIGAYTANIKFDPSVFEYASSNGMNGWEAPFYQDGAITANTQNAEVVGTPQDIGTITLKVKKDAKLGESTVELSNFSGSNGLTDVDTTNEAIKITIVGSNNNNGSNNGGNNGGTSGSNNGNNGTGSGTINNGTTTNNGSNKGNSSNNSSTNNNANTNIPTTSKTTTDTSIKQGALPQTGTGDVIIFTILGSASLLAITFFTRMVILNRKMK